MFKGENLARKNYRARLAACREAGQPIQALSAADEARLGSGRGDIAINARHQVARQITWTASGDGSDLQRTCMINLEQLEDRSESTDTNGLYEAIDAGTRRQDRLVAEASGWKLVDETEVQGQPCTRWQNDRQEICRWSGGLQWGFSDAPANVAGCSVTGAYLTSIPLQGQPAENGGGCRLVIESFSLGKGLLPSP